MTCEKAPPYPACSITGLFLEPQNPFSFPEGVGPGPLAAFAHRTPRWSFPQAVTQTNKNNPPPLCFNNKSRGFLGGAVVENLPANAGDTGSSPSLGRSHMPWSSWAREPQLLSLSVWSLCSTTTEPARLEPVLRNKRGCDGERPAHRDEEWPPLAATRESPRTEKKTQHSHK